MTTTSIARSSSGSSSGSKLSSSESASSAKTCGASRKRLVDLLLALRARLLDDERDLVLGHERALHALEA